MEGNGYCHFLDREKGGSMSKQGNVFTDILGGVTERHDDGSTTTRTSYGHSVTRDAEGEVRETSKPESSAPWPLNHVSRNDIVVTRDGEGNVINTTKKS